jgi:DNA modification methylase
MITDHRVVTGNAADMPLVDAASVELVVTSPPYPMIAMWDEMFIARDSSIEGAFRGHDGLNAFDLMHEQLHGAWKAAWNALIPGGMLCINIGDATRTIGDRFRLYANHSRVIEQCSRIGFDVLPAIHWYKPTNAPNKFMGSGMLPPGAYVTLEHEYVLLFRKGGKREFGNSDRERRRRSAFFWEERNVWFADQWSIGSVRQDLAAGEHRARSAAFPLELPLRLICMFSLEGDTVLDPFAGTGTTARAAAATGRNSISIDIEPHFCDRTRELLVEFPPRAAAVQRDRVADHRSFVSEQAEAGRVFKHTNPNYGPVVTSQEQTLVIRIADRAEQTDTDTIQFRYVDPDEAGLESNP